MRLDGDFHMHTTASDGHCSVRELAAEARKMGLAAIAVTDHSFSGLSRRMTLETLEEERREAERESGVKIYIGVEANLVDLDGKIDVPDELIRRADVLSVGFHRFVGLLGSADREFLLVNGYASERARQRLKEKNTRAFLMALERYPVDVVAHLGHRCPVDFVQVCEACARLGTYVELNEKHVADARGFEQNFDKMVATGVEFIVGSDAHRARDVARFDRVLALLEESGVQADRVCGAEGNAPAFKDRSEWKNEL